MKEFTITECKKFIETASDLMNENRQFLIDLDSKMGDGDLGITMSLGFNKAKEFTSTFNDNDLGKFFFQTGMTISKAVPSTMGTLVASAFMEAGKQLKGKTAMSSHEFATLSKGLAFGIMNRGKAKPGDRTIVDCLYPAYEAALKAAEDNSDLETTIKASYNGACIGLENTKNMTPTFGKAFYHQSEAIGVQDQGATVGMLIYKAWIMII